MKEKEKYDNAFREAFSVENGDLSTLSYQSIEKWDSVGHMALIATLEDTFDIMMETDDIIAFESYEKGFELLTTYDVEF